MQNIKRDDFLRGCFSAGIMLGLWLFEDSPSPYRHIFLLLALVYPLLWIGLLPHILTQIEQDGIRFWTWRGKQFVAWSEFIEFDRKGTKHLLRTRQKTYTWKLQWYNDKIYNEYVELIKTRVPMTTELRTIVEAHEAWMQKQGVAYEIAYDDWPIGKPVRLPVSSRYYYVLTGTILICGLVSAIPFALILSEGDIAANLDPILFFGVFSLAAILFAVWMWVQLITIDEQGVQVRKNFTRYAIAWHEIEFVATEDMGQQKRLSFTLETFNNKRRIKQALLQKMRQHKLPLKAIQKHQSKSQNTKI
jgi:hypothetical protein